MRLLEDASLALACAIVISAAGVLDVGPQLRPLDVIVNAVSIDRTGKSDNGGCPSQSLATITWAQITDDLPDRLLLAIVNVKGSSADTWIHYKSGSTDINMTFLGSSNDAGLAAPSQLWYYLWSPPIGSFNLTATTTIAVLPKLMGESIVLYNVDQAGGVTFGSPVDQNGGGTTTTASISLTMNQGDFLLGSIITLGVGAVAPTHTPASGQTTQITDQVSYACPGPANFATLTLGTQPSANTFTWTITDGGGSPFSDLDIVRVSPTVTQVQQPPGGVPSRPAPCTTPACRIQDLGNTTIVILQTVNLWVWIFLAMVIVAGAVAARSRRKIPEGRR